LKIGQHLILGFEGTSPSKDFLRLLKEEEIGGVILFSRNVESREQLIELIDKLKKTRGAPMLISVDHEGGRVFRLPQPFTAIPTAREFGQYYEHSRDLKLIEEIAELIAYELRSVGFNLNYAPVLDVDSCQENPIIGDRSFHQDPDIVAQVACAFIAGFNKANLISCGKHFPGHGDTMEDSHKTLPQVAQDRNVLESRELRPFIQAIAAGVPTLMSAHVMYPALDSNCCGTLSSTINRDLLRDRLGFKGVLFSDDLFMKGVSPDVTAVPNVAVQSFLGSCDILLLCHDEDCQRVTIDHLKKEIEASITLQSALAVSSPRVTQLLSRAAQIEGVPLGPVGDSAILANKLAKLAL
jgi:beta-N-acetylhexosaminidase